MYKGYYDNQYRPRFITVDGSELPYCLDRGENGWKNFHSWSMMYPQMITDPGKSKLANYVFFVPEMKRIKMKTESER